MYLLFCFKRKIGTKVAPKAFGEHVLYSDFTLTILPISCVKTISKGAFLYSFVFRKKTLQFYEIFLPLYSIIFKVIKEKLKTFKKMFNSLC